MRRHLKAILGILAAVAIVSVAPATTVRAEYKIDDTGSFISMTTPKGATSRTSSSGEIYFYDANGNVAKSQTPSGYLVDYSYDVNGNILSSQEHKYDGMSWGTTKYEYDAQGRVIAELDGEGDANYNYVYEGNKVIKTESYYPYATYVYTYDAAGRLASLEANGEIFLYTYDAAGRIAQIAYYTAVGTIEYSDYTYDANGYIQTEYQHNSYGTEACYTYTNVYDAAGRIVSVDNARGTVYTFGY